MSHKRSIRIVLAGLGMAWFVFQAIVVLMEMAVGRVADMGEAWDQMKLDVFIAAFLLMMMTLFFSQNEREKAEQKSAMAKKLFEPAQLPPARNKPAVPQRPDSRPPKIKHIFHTEPPRTPKAPVVQPPPIRKRGIEDRRDWR